MKESEARKKWCPHVALSHTVMLHTLSMIYAESRQTKEDDADYRATSAKFNFKCKGSECVMWSTIGWDDDHGDCGLKSSCD